MMSDYVMPMNMGNPEELTMLELAQEIVALTKRTSMIVYKGLPEADPKVRQPDILTNGRHRTRNRKYIEVKT